MADNILPFPNKHESSREEADSGIRSLYEYAKSIAGERNYEHVIIMAGRDNQVINLIGYGYVNGIHQRDSLNQAIHLTYLCEEIPEEDVPA